MNVLPLLIQIVALVCLFIAALGWFTTPAPRPQWGWLGMALWLLSLMISGIELHTVR